MENNNKTPKPDSEQYNVEKPQDLNVPKFNSSTGYRDGAGLPAVENLDDMVEDGAGQLTGNKAAPDYQESPKPDLGNEQDSDEAEDERIISK